MKLLSFQPFTIYRNGGGSRVLRRLYAGHEKNILSVAIVSSDDKAVKGPIREKIFKLKPIKKKWMRWKLRNINSWIQHRYYKLYLKKKIFNFIEAQNRIDVIHSINHGSFSTLLADYAKENGIPLWVSFHDHFLTTSSYQDTKKLWNQADRRLVISKELGDFYKSEFGNNFYEVITDGILKTELSTPNFAIHNNEINIYFMGLLHQAYIPLFEILANALELLTEENNFKVNLIFRGGHNLPFLNDRKFNVEYRNSFLSDSEIKEEMDSASILYFPMKFNDPNFYLYSFSTKMVNYLGGSGSILYHGPEDSAAYNFLKQYSAAACCTSLNKLDLYHSLVEIIKNREYYSKNAKIAAEEEFSMEKIRHTFWSKK